MKKIVKNEIDKIKMIFNADELYLDSQKKSIEKWLDKNYKSIIFRPLLPTLARFSVANSFKDIVGAYESEVLSKVASEGWSAKEHARLDIMLITYGKYAEYFFYYKNHILNDRYIIPHEVESGLQMLAKKHRGFSNNKTFEISTGYQEAFFEKVQRKVGEKELETNKSEIVNLEKRNTELEKELEMV